MAQSLSQIYVHTVFSTKDHVPFLQDKDLRQTLHSQMGGIMKRLGCQPVRIGGVADHVHLLSTLSRTETVANLVKETKRLSTAWVNENSPKPLGFKWQGGYGAFSVSPAHVKAVSAYIDNQEEHHRTVTFKEEYLGLLEKYEIQYDERYVWD